MRKLSGYSSRILLITIFITALFLHGCTKKIEEKPMGEQGTRTIFIYMCGSTLETKAGAASKNISDMLRCTISDNTSVIIQTGGSKKWRSHGINADMSQRYLIKNGELVLLSEDKAVNMGKSETLQDFLSWGIENYPAEKMGVIMWDHGGGSLTGVCFDEQYNMDSLTLDEIDKAFMAVKEKMTDRFEYVGFDACLMANYETAKIMSRYARHMIASEDVEPSGGWDYKSVVTGFGDENYYTDLLEGYGNKCEESGIHSYTLSDIDLNSFNSIDKASDNFFKSLSTTAQGGLKPVIDAVGDSIAFGYNSWVEGYSNLVDLADFARIIHSEELTNTIKQYVKCVNGEERRGAYGMSVYYPLGDTEDIEKYMELPVNETYSQFLRRHYSVDKNEELITFTDKGSNRNGELHVALSEESMQYMYDMEYHLFQFVEASEYVQAVYGIGSDNDIISEGEYGFTTSFGGKWVKMNDQFLNTTIVQRRENITIFSAPVKCNGETGTIRFVYDGDTGNINIQGFLAMNDSGASERLQQIVKGDIITILYDERTEDYSLNLLEGQTFEVNDTPNIVVGELPDGYYQSYIVVTDIFGKQYYSNDAVVVKRNGKMYVDVISEDVDHSILK